MNIKWLVLVLGLVILVGLFYGEDEDSLLIPNDGVDNLHFLSDLEKDVIIELNQARTNPAEYAEKIEDFKRHYVGMYIYFAGRMQVKTKEGVSAVNEAIEFLNSALRRDPEDTEALYNLGLIDMSRGKADSAKKHFQRVISIDPNHRGAYLDLSNVCVGQEAEKILMNKLGLE